MDLEDLDEVDLRRTRPGAETTPFEASETSGWEATF